MHYIQKKILYNLALNKMARYSELKPFNIEGNLFIYHLKQLIKGKLVQKNADKTYSLTAQGRAYLDQVSLGSFKIRSQAKIVSLIACSNDKNEWLLYKRKHQPFIGLIGFPYGKVHLGETIKQSSERELKEKTGLIANLKHRGDVYVTVFDDSTLITHTLFHIHTSKNPEGKLNEATSFGYCFWTKIDYSQPEQYFPGFLDILDLIDKNPSKHFFKEYTYSL